MTKSKMAVRNNANKRQLALNFNIMPRNKTFFHMILVLLLGFAGLYGCYQIKMYWHRALPIEQITVSGNPQNVSKAKIINLIKQQPLDGLLAIDLEKLRQQVQQIDWVKQAEIRKEWPNQLLISVVEHIPLAQFENSILTEMNTLISTPSEDRKLAIPFIKVANVDSKDAKNYQLILQEFDQLIHSLSALNLQIKQLTINETESWHLSFDNGMRVELGRKQRNERIERLAQVYQMIENQKNIQSIDLRYHNGIAVIWQQNELAETKKSIQNG